MRTPLGYTLGRVSQDRQTFESREPQSPRGFLSPRRWPLALALYAALAFVAALAIEPIDSILRQNGIAGPWAAVLASNVLYPLSIILAAAWHPRKRLIPLGCLLALCGFTAGRLFAHDVPVPQWTLTKLAHASHPVILAGTLVAGALAELACVGLHPWRRVGVPDADRRCKACGYLTDGLESAICPECGAAITPGR